MYKVTRRSGLRWLLTVASITGLSFLAASAAMAADEMASLRQPDASQAAPTTTATAPSASAEASTASSEPTEFDKLGKDLVEVTEPIAQFTAAINHAVPELDAAHKRMLDQGETLAARRQFYRDAAKTLTGLIDAAAEVSKRRADADAKFAAATGTLDKERRKAGEASHELQMSLPRKAAALDKLGRAERDLKQEYVNARQSGAIPPELVDRIDGLRHQKELAEIERDNDAAIIEANKEIVAGIDRYLDQTVRMRRDISGLFNQIEISGARVKGFGRIVVAMAGATDQATEFERARADLFRAAGDIRTVSKTMKELIPNLGNLMRKVTKPGAPVASHPSASNAESARGDLDQWANTP